MVLLWFYLIVPGFLQNVLGLSPKTDIRLISAMVAFSMFRLLTIQRLSERVFRVFPVGSPAPRWRWG